MSDSFTCPFCNHTIPVVDSTFTQTLVGFPVLTALGYRTENDYSIEIRMYKCPNCKKTASFADYVGSELPEKTIPIFPISNAKQFPEYIPTSIRNDYEEACAIVNLSPKASATLSRRCLQGMIRDFFQIAKNNLYEEIDAIKPKIPTEQWAVLDGLRRIGNIGAHMEKDINLIIDIEPDEAQKLIKLIELLIQQWYIERHNQQQLYADIIGIDDSKQNLRKKTEQETTLFLLCMDHFPQADSH